MHCWEFKGCKWIEDCAAYPDHGDCCTAMKGTLCCDNPQLVGELLSCKRCSFFNSEHYNHTRAEKIISELY